MKERNMKSLRHWKTLAGLFVVFSILAVITPKLGGALEDYGQAKQPIGKEGIMIKKAYVDTKQGQIHYRYTDGSKTLPVVVMIHQTTSTSVMFEAVMARLARYYRIIAPDFPGYGESFIPDNVPGIGYYTDVLIEALDNLGVKDFHVVGHHTGGAIALDMTVRYPERIHTLAIIGPIYGSQAERVELRKISTEKVNQLVPQADGSHLLRGWKMLETYGAHTVSVEHHQREAMDHLKAWKACGQAYNAVLDQDFCALFDKVKGPLMIMCSPDDVLWPYWEPAKKARPDAEAVVVKGHDYQCDEDPDGVAEALHCFLQKSKVK
ncbi:MAG: alpha/beta hydrolase [Pseudomonadota bacterium]